MKIIGITGGVGAGKTQILEYLNNKYGATICMTDEVGKKLQKKGTECFDEIVAHFGNEILDEKGELDRAKLSDIVFADRVELSVLNGIVHPRVKEEIQKKITREERRNTNLMLIEGALLIEDHYEEICDELWYVYVEDSIRRKRLKYARGYEDSKVDQIFEAGAFPSHETFVSSKKPMPVAAGVTVAVRKGRLRRRLLRGRSGK